MANGAPGPGGSRTPAGGKVIHLKKELAGKERAEAEKTAEVAAGIRCGGCGVRVRHGFEFVFVDVGRIDGRAYANYHNLVACGGIDGCDFAAVCGENAVAMREVRHTFLDTPEMRQLLKGRLAKEKKA